MAFIYDEAEKYTYIGIEYYVITHSYLPVHLYSAKVFFSLYNARSFLYRGLDSNL